MRFNSSNLRSANVIFTSIYCFLSIALIVASIIYHEQLGSRFIGILVFGIVCLILSIISYYLVYNEKKEFNKYLKK
jgi:uncharacterized membrane protein